MLIAMKLCDQSFQWQMGNLNTSDVIAAIVIFNTKEVTHPELLQIHHQTVVCKTGGKPAEEDNR